MTNINTFQGDVFIPEYIKHTGDDNNLFGFSGTDTFKISTAGVDAIKVDASQNIDITGLIRHIGDENTYFGFSGADAFVVRTNGSDRINVNNAGNVTLSVNLYIPDYVFHSGDTHTYFGFSGDNTYVVRTGGTDRLTINDSAVAVAGTLTAGTKLETPLISRSGTLTLGSSFNYLTDIRGGGTVKFSVDNVQRGVFNVNGLTLQNGGTALNYFKENANGGAWSALGQNATGFNVNGNIAYQRVGNFCILMARRVQFYAQGNFYLRHTVPTEFRPNPGGDVLAWNTRVTTNSAFTAQAYYSQPYIYSVRTAAGNHFTAGGGTQHNFSAHSTCYTV